MAVTVYERETCLVNLRHSHLGKKQIITFWATIHNPRLCFPSKTQRLKANYVKITDNLVQNVLQKYIKKFKNRYLTFHLAIYNC